MSKGNSHFPAGVFTKEAAGSSLGNTSTLNTKYL
jgi:hypothetical protein